MFLVELHNKLILLIIIVSNPIITQKNLFNVRNKFIINSGLINGKLVIKKEAQFNDFSRLKI